MIIVVDASLIENQSIIQREIKNKDKKFKNKLEEKLRKLYFSRAHGDIAILARVVTIILYKWPSFNEIKLLPLFGNKIYMKSLYWVPFLPFWSLPSNNIDTRTYGQKIIEWLEERGWKERPTKRLNLA